MTVNFSVSGYPGVTTETRQFTVRDTGNTEVIISHTALEIAAGASDSYKVSLTQAPAANETVTVTVTVTELSIDFAPMTVELTTANWEQGVDVTLTLGNRSTGGTVTHEVTATRTGGDTPVYDGVTTASAVTVTVPSGSN